MSTVTFKNVRRIFLSSLILFGATSALANDAAQTDGSFVTQQQNLPVYAAYASETARARCSTHSSCKLDHITQADFENGFHAIFGSSYSDINAEHFSAFQNTLNQGDYEVLISAVSFEPTQQALTLLEYTLQWRGIPIFEHTVRSQTANVKNDVENDVKNIVLAANIEFIETMTEQDILSPAFLFSALGASNYQTELAIPQAVKGFSLEQTQLQADPTLGMLARYTHDNFPSAIVDLYVYPTLDHDFTTNEASVLRNELQKDVSALQSLALQRGISTLELSDIHATDLNAQGVASTLSGYALNAQAVHGGDTLHTAQYIFMVEDKFVKFSANVPAAYVVDMVTDIMQQLKVPKASEIMKAFRLVNQRQLSQSNDSLNASTQATPHSAAEVAL